MTMTAEPAPPHSRRRVSMKAHGSGEWRAFAACAGEDPELFFDCISPAARTKAKRICGACPARDECLAEAMAQEASMGTSLKQRHGIWGGLTAHERWRIANPDLAAEEGAEGEEDGEPGE